MQNADHNEKAPYRRGHDETPSNTEKKKTHTHMKSHTLCGNNADLLLDTCEEKEQLKVTRLQRRQNNAIILSLWIDLRRTRMRK